MKKLAIIIPYLSRGGAERVTIYLSQFMAGRGVECEIITFKRWEYEYEVPKGVKRIILLAENQSRISLIPKMRKAFIKSGADVLLIMDVSTCIYAIPAVIGLEMKVVVSERNSPFNFSGKRVVRILSKQLMKYADGYVFQTRDAKGYYDKALKGRGVIISNPLLNESLPDIYEGERKKTIVAVGRLSRQKNHICLIKAFSQISSQFPDYSLEIYGEGELRGELANIIERYGLSGKIKLKGNRERVLENIRKASIFVLPSLYEGMPNALIEAMALGIPCIAADCPSGGPKELIKNGLNGILVRVNDVSGLAIAIRKLLLNPGIANRLGKAAVIVRQNLDSERIGIQWKDYMDELSHL